MKYEMTSKERILRTIEWKETDHLPLTINGICHTHVVDLHNKFNKDLFKISDYCLELGTDTGIRFSMPFAFPDDVGINYLTRRVPGERHDIFTKEYITPKGKLVQAVRKNEHFPFDKIEIFSDHLVPPERSYKYMVDAAHELDALECIFAPPGENAYAKTWEFAREAKKFADSRGIVLTCSLDGIGDPLLWLSGVENIVYMSADDPGALHRYIGILSDWNVRRLNTYIDMGVDYINRRGWYESTDFWSPAMFREFLLPPLKREAQIAHAAGIKYTYIMNSGVDALAGMIAEAGVDMLTNVEPEMNDILALRKTLRNKVAMCSGVNNYHVIEMGGEAEIDEAVRYAVENYAPGGGLILCPSDCVGGFDLYTGGVSEKILTNTLHLVSAWKKYCQ